MGLVAFSFLTFGGCATITLPENIDVGYGRPAPKVDSRKVPQTNTLSDCHTELYRAYGYIRSLERRNQKLEEDKAELKTENSRLKKRYKKYEE